MSTAHVPSRPTHTVAALVARWRHRRLLAMLRRTRRRGPAPTPASLLKGRQDFEDVGLLMGVPEGATPIDDDADGVPVQWLDRRPGTAAPTEGPGPVVFYVHGGAYAMGSAIASRHAADTFLRPAGALGCLVDYRLAPEHPWPGGLEDVKRAWDWLVRDRDASDVVVLGESAGGGLALALVGHLRDTGQALPAGLVTISAWADLAMAGPSYDERRERDLALDVRLLREAADAYLGSGADPHDPSVSPVHLDFTGFPRMLAVVGTEEVVWDDTSTIHRKATAAGVDVRLVVGRDQIHCFPGYAPRGLPAAIEAVEHVTAFIAEATGG